MKLKINPFSVSVVFLKKCSALDPVDTGRKLNARAGRLLKVLCTFNLRPVSTGEVISVVSKALYT